MQEIREAHAAPEAATFADAARLVELFVSIQEICLRLPGQHDGDDV